MREMTTQYLLLFLLLPLFHVVHISYSSIDLRSAANRFTSSLTSSAFNRHFSVNPRPRPVYQKTLNSKSALFFNFGILKAVCKKYLYSVYDLCIFCQTSMHVVSRWCFRYSDFLLNKYIKSSFESLLRNSSCGFFEFSSFHL